MKTALLLLSILVLFGGALSACFVVPGPPIPFPQEAGATAEALTAADGGLDAPEEAP
jgi:hypothetical protein